MKPFFRNIPAVPNKNKPSQKPEQLEALEIQRQFNAEREYEVIACEVDEPKIILTDAD